ncbi:hypothetical protein BX666DRAFT_1956142 [Dichotomocladium elegans]|nr:hypothetical protein BX666DRAFT_1956142 [Dichotomocladium elegans]
MATIRDATISYQKCSIVWTGSPGVVDLRKDHVIASTPFFLTPADFSLANNIISDGIASFGTSPSLA